jgi:pectinesterase
MKRSVVIFLLSFLFVAQLGAQTSNPQQYKYVFTVAKDGTGDYAFIQDAIDAMRVYPLAPITLYIKNGVYNEKIELPANNTDVNFIGENVDSTIIIFNDYSGKGKLTTFTSYTAKISGNRFRAENITFANSAGPVGQALALYVDADKAVFKNCKFLGNQDTIFTSGENARQLFYRLLYRRNNRFYFWPFNSCISKLYHQGKNKFIYNCGEYYQTPEKTLAMFLWIAK